MDEGESSVSAGTPSNASRKDASDKALNEELSGSSPGVDGSPDGIFETGTTFTFNRIEDDSK